MLDTFLTIFYQVCIQLINICVPVFGIYLIMDFISSFLFNKR